MGVLTVDSSLCSLSLVVYCLIGLSSLFPDGISSIDLVLVTNNLISHFEV